MKKWYLISCILVLVGLASLGACAPPPKEVPTVEEALAIEPEQVRLEYEADEEAAKAKYEGKIVTVSGVVDDTSEQWKTATVVPPEFLGGGWPAAVYARIPDIEVIRSLQRGQEVTIVGTFHEYMMAAHRVVIIDSYVVEE